MRGFRTVRTIFVALVVLNFGLPAIAQVSFENAEWQSMSNRYVKIDLGVRGTVKVDNSQWGIAGRWAVSTTEGDPETTQDNNRPLVYFAGICPAHYFGYWKIRVGNNVYMVGDSNTGYWSKVPYTYRTPPPGYGVGRAGGYIEGEWTVNATDASGQTTASVSMRIKMSIVRDQCRFDITLINRAAATQTIGLCMTGDVMVGDSNLGVGYAYIPGRGYVRTAVVSPKPYPQILKGAKIPDVFEVYDSVENPASVARNTLRLQDCVAPDYVALGEWSELVGANNWPPTDYNPDFLKEVGNLAWVICWNPTSVPRGGFRRIITYYGVGAASAAWNYRIGSKLEQDSVVLAVQGPRSLKYNSVTGTNELDGQPFAIKAYVYNLATDPGRYDLDDVTLTLYLPAGLKLSTSRRQSAQQTIGRVPVDSESLPATWDVEATGEYSGELEYFVTARAASGWQQIVSRKIMVPATKRSVFRSGYQLMHVPFTFNNPAIEHVFGLPRGSFGAKYYDSATGQYLPVTQVEPGRAFWMYVGGVQRGRTLPFVLAEDAAIVAQQMGKQLDEVDVDLKPGWNLIGNPFVYPVYWGQVLVWNKVGNITVSLDQAVTNGWISRTLFTWVPESSSYESFKDNDHLLLPWRGYWVRARYPVTLVFRPEVPPGSDVTANPDGT
ncbi:MAG: hypothetical protein N3B12_03725 [Armatimonadetes bacterium]|nr:hypothetical protein [Armatimonadota bacterium]